MFKFSKETFLLAAMLMMANLAACSSDATSAGANNATFNKDIPTDTAHLKDTVYIPVQDTIFIPVKDTVAESSSSAFRTSSASTETNSSTAMTTASSDIPGLSSSEKVAPCSSSTEPPSEDFLWNDEFDGTSVDTSKWSFEIGTGNNGWGNSELEYYTDRPENAYVKDGMLHIRASLETSVNDIAQKFGGQKYTSARMTTKGKSSFTYGTVEARIALPSGKGIWPAFWMLGANSDKVGWPQCGEIDIIESVNEESVVYGSYHWEYQGGHAQYSNSTRQHFDGHYDLDITEFHVYKMTWDKNAISMYVDDFMYQKIDIADATSEMGTFHKPFFFILNVAVGGSWPGFEIDDSQFPTEMLVDYIRVYR